MRFFKTPPKTVDQIVEVLFTMTEELNALYQVKRDEAEELAKKSAEARAESTRAANVLNSIRNIIT
jgi:DNA repair ATPase RecN